MKLQKKQQGINFLTVLTSFDPDTETQLLKVNMWSLEKGLYHMLCGALLTVRRMVKRPPPTAPTLRTSSLDCFKAAWPAKADCWIAEVAIFL